MSKYIITTKGIQKVNTVGIVYANNAVYALEWFMLMRAPLYLGADIEYDEDIDSAVLSNRGMVFRATPELVKKFSIV